MPGAPFVYEGWICVPYEGADLAKVELAVGDAREPAYLDWANDQRVAKLRPAHVGYPEGTVTVRLYVDGVVSGEGRVTV
jgi:hypothetical protein